jgi:hypothetical protein
MKEGLVLGFIVSSRPKYLQNILKLLAIWRYEEYASTCTS